MNKTAYILTLNIRGSIFEHYGLQHFNHLKNISIGNGEKLHILPVVNNLNDDIEKRARALNTLVPKLLSKLNAQKAHLISYSASGLDARYGLSYLSLKNHCLSLTTIATPNKGSKLATLSERKIFSEKQIEPISRLMGIGLKPFWELNSSNIHFFNQNTPDAANVKYFSIGGERLPNNMSEHLQKTGNYLRNKIQPNFVYQNDGIIGHDECIWGEHLINFEADHSQIIGITNAPALNQMFSLINENISFHFDQATQQQLN